MKPILSALPADASLEPLPNSFPLKVRWVYDEWDGAHEPIVARVRKVFPKRETILEALTKRDVNLHDLIKQVFYEIRGRYSLWGPELDAGRWQKVSFDALELSWVRDNVDVLFAFPNDKPLSELDGPVIWFDPEDHHFDRVSREQANQRMRNSASPFKLIEGNHRVSAWINLGAPAALKATIYVGHKAE